MAGDPNQMYIVSNDGTTQLATWDGTSYSPFTVTSTGVKNSQNTALYTYSGNDTFIGLATTVGATAPVYAIGDTFTTTAGSVLYIVTAQVITYKKMTYDGNKVQVDSAIRDGNGVKIDTNYQKKHTTATATLSSSSWSSNTQTVSVSGVTSSNTVIVSPAPASISAYGDAGVYCSAQGAGTLTFACSTTPSSSITVNVVILP